jgi:clan AA aspartic protease (TIGR02281 family)
MKGIKVLSVTALAVITSGLLQAQGAPQVVNLSDALGVMKASWTGDQTKLAYVAGSMSGGPDVLAKALYQRSLYKLEESSMTVAACGALAELGKSSANSQCGLILAGNKLLSNDIAGWAKIMDANRSAAYAQYAQALHVSTSDLHIREYEPVADFKPYFDFPAISVTRDAENFTLPLDWTTFRGHDKSGIWMVWVMVNGKRIHAVLDTGTAGVVLTQADADSTGIDHIHKEWIKINQGTPSKLGVAKEMDLGAVHIKNMPVVISDTSPKFSLIGINALQYLDAIQIADATLTSKTEGFGGACATPMTMASWIDGLDNALLVQGKVANKPFPFFLDTGDAWGVSRNIFGTPPADATTQTVSMQEAGVDGQTITSDAHEMMQIGEASPANQELRILYNDHHTRFRYDIGAFHVHSHKLVIDFKQGLLCLK